jgi:hypothetical protein
MAGTALFENYALHLAAAIGCRDLRLKSARLPTELCDGGTIVRHLYDDLKQSLDAAIAGPDYRPSAENFRWFKPQLAISAANKSPEVIFERAVIQACCRLGRSDWANQVPLVSGIAGPRAYKRRAIDLVRRVSDRAFEFVELKIASDTPLYAAAEIVLYGLLWLHARGRNVESSGPQNPLLDANIIKLSVLAPPVFYGQSDTGCISSFFSSGLGALAERHGVEMSLAFTAFPFAFTRPAALADGDLVRLLDDRRPV